ncbi:MAG: DEAD/DEAH box helicase [Alphaproteobacteria bacterium]|nr:MAG: DEAD/DEAH box helicase [Alphaproteobacteria bacterium]
MDVNEVIEDYRDLVREDVARYIPGTAITFEGISRQVDYSKLLLYASIFALSPSERDQEIAYDIAVRVIELYGHEKPSIAKAAEHILARLGNFPGRNLLRARHQSDLGGIRSISLSLESLMREVENTVQLTGRPLTDFQREIIEKSEKFNLVSIAAPTSAGKSFIMSLDIIRRLRASLPTVVVYVVPTRALLRQVSQRLVRTLRNMEMGSVTVLTMPFPLDHERKRGGVVYVLTQERLQVLLQLSSEELPSINHLVVDEAHGIAEGARGVVLHAAIEETLFRFPEATASFASPLVANPWQMINLFANNRTSFSILNEVPTVTQNVILMNKRKRTRNQWDVEVLLGDDKVSVGTWEIPMPDFSSVFSMRAFFANLISGENDSTIIYANRPSDAEKLALEVARQVGVSENYEEIEDLREFISEQVHPDYLLREVLKSRVAFHHGKMPALVRSKVEDLLEQGIIKFVCCTSTLLQGVNLPAKHIVLDRPTRGGGQPLERSEFRNLAGRAGRLTYEFQGNVWCLDTTKWKQKSFQGRELDSVVASYDSALEADSGLVGRALKNQLTDRETPLATAVTSKAFLDLRVNRREIDRPISDELRQSLSLAKEASESLETELPDNIFRNNTGILPNRLNELFEELRQRDNLESCTPLFPRRPRAKERLREVFRLCHLHLEGSLTSAYKYHADIAHMWIQEATLREILERFYRERTDVSRGTSIGSIVGVIEHELHHKYARNVRAYLEILQIVQREKNPEAIVEIVTPLHSFLECGASNHHVIAFIHAGLSRHTSVTLHRYGVRVEEPVKMSQVMDLLSSLDLERLRIPKTSAREVRTLLDYGVLSMV